MSGGGLLRLQECLPDLAESEAKVAEFILREPGTFVNLTISQLAKESGSSQAAAVRLWKSLGFAGYRDFQMRVAGDLHAGVADGYEELRSGGSFATILDSVLSTTVESIQGTLSLLKEGEMDRAVESIVEARRIVTFGVGASGVVAADFAQKLMRTGFPVFLAQDFHAAAVLAAQLEPGDLLVAVSYSGSTSDICEVAGIAATRRARILAITRYADTPLQRIAAIRLNVNAKEPEMRVAATASRLSGLVVIDALFLYLANCYPQRVYPFLEATRGVVQGHRLRP